MVQEPSSQVAEAAERGEGAGGEMKGRGIWGETTEGGVLREEEGEG